MIHEAIVLLRGHAALTSVGNLVASATVTLLKGTPNVLVDTGDCWQREELVDALAAQGVEPGQIEYVVLTHGHLDHVGNNNLFAHATFVLDNDVARDGEYWIHDFARGPFVIEVTGGGEPIQVVATPGHTDHDVSVVVRTAIGIVAVVGDLFEREGDWNDNAWQYWSKNVELQQLSRDRMLAAADFIIPGHGDGFVVTRDVTG